MYSYSSASPELSCLGVAEGSKSSISALSEFSFRPLPLPYQGHLLLGDWGNIKTFQIVTGLLNHIAGLKFRIVLRSFRKHNIFFFIHLARNFREPFKPLWTVWTWFPTRQINVRDVNVIQNPIQLMVKSLLWKRIRPHNFHSRMYSGLKAGSRSSMAIENRLEQ